MVVRPTRGPMMGRRCVGLSVSVVFRQPMGSAGGDESGRVAGRRVAASAES